MGSDVLAPCFRGLRVFPWALLIFFHWQTSVSSVSVQSTPPPPISTVPQVRCLACTRTGPLGKVLKCQKCEVRVHAGKFFPAMAHFLWTYYNWLAHWIILRWWSIVGSCGAVLLDPTKPEKWTCELCDNDQTQEASLVSQKSGLKEKGLSSDHLSFPLCIPMKRTRTTHRTLTASYAQEEKLRTGKRNLILRLTLFFASANRRSSNAGPTSCVLYFLPKQPFPKRIGYG